MEVRESAWMQQYYRKALLITIGFGAVIAIGAVAGELWLQTRASADGVSTLSLALGIAFSLLLMPIAGRVRRGLLGGGSGLHAVVDQVMVPQNRYRRMLQAVAWSLTISVLPAFIGLGLVVAGAGRAEFYLFTGWAVLMFALYVPRYRQWQAWFAQRSQFR